MFYFYKNGLKFTFLLKMLNKKYYYVIYIIWNSNGSFKWNFS